MKAIVLRTRNDQRLDIVLGHLDSTEKWAFWPFETFNWTSGLFKSCAWPLRQGVKAIVLRTLNDQRLDIVLSHRASTGGVLTPEEARFLSLSLSLSLSFSL